MSMPMRSVLKRPELSKFTELNFGDINSFAFR